MTASAAVVGIVLALIAGFYFSRYDRAERTARLARAAAGTAGAQVWRARRTIFVIGLAVFAVVNLWFRGRGRL
jgi:hypothetical protein